MNNVLATIYFCSPIGNKQFSLVLFTTKQPGDIFAVTVMISTVGESLHQITV